MIWTTSRVMRFLRRAVSESMLQGDVCFSEKSRKTKRKTTTFGNLRKRSKTPRVKAGSRFSERFLKINPHRARHGNGWLWGDSTLSTIRFLFVFACFTELHSIPIAISLYFLYTFSQILGWFVPFAAFAWPSRAINAHMGDLTWRGTCYAQNPQGGKCSHDADEDFVTAQHVAMRAENEWVLELFSEFHFTNWWSGCQASSIVYSID